MSARNRSLARSRIDLGEDVTIALRMWMQARARPVSQPPAPTKYQVKPMMPQLGPVGYPSPVTGTRSVIAAGFGPRIGRRTGKSDRVGSKQARTRNYTL